MTLTNDDFKAFSDLISEIIDEKTRTVLVTKEEIKHLPTTEEFHNESDRLMKELKTVREEITILSDLQRQVHGHDQRLEKVERKLNLQTL